MLRRAVSWLDGAPRIISVAIGATLWMAFYTIPAHFPLYTATPWPQIFIDEKIPVITWTIFIYLSVFIQIAFGLALLKPGIIGRAILAAFLLLSVHAVFFVFMPSTLPREELLIEGAFWQWGYSLMWMFDKPVNCFPSLHVSVAVLAGLAFRRQNRKWGTVFLIWATLISLSTMTTKQHFFLDIVVGSLIALACYQAVFTYIIPDHALIQKRIPEGRIHPALSPSGRQAFPKPASSSQFISWFTFLK